MSKLLSADNSYRDWIQEVSNRFRQSQIRAAVKVNDEMLRFYWNLGRDISRMSEQAKYGTGFIKQSAMIFRIFSPMFIHFL